MRVPWLMHAYVTLQRLRTACVVTLPSFRDSDWLQFQTAGTVSYETLGFRIRPLMCPRSFFAYCATIDDRTIATMVKRAATNIGLQTGTVERMRHKASGYEIPLTGVFRATHIEIFLHRSAVNFSGTFCRIMIC